MKEQPSSTSTNPLAPTTRTGRVTPCCSKVGLKRGPWTREEDELLCSYVRREGEGRWRAMPKKAGLLRCGKSCRLRWMNYLRPSVKRGNFAPDEEDLILRLHRLLGNRWSLIAGRIPGRTDNEIKNYWNTHLSKKLISQGIDPRTHKPLNPNNNNHPSNNNYLKIPSPNLNPNHQSLHLDETHMTKDMITTVNEQHDYANNTVGDGVDCLADDLFSSFLSSIINDDAFQKEVENNSNNINNHCSSSSNICKNERKSDDNNDENNNDTATNGDVDFWKNVNLDESDHHQYMDFLDQIDEKLQY